MRGDAASMRPHASPFAHSYDPVELFSAVLLCRLHDPAHPSVVALAARARADARADARLGRALDEAIDTTALRLAYEHARADAAAIKPVREIPEEGPRWWRVLAGLAALRHRQRAALSLFYVVGVSMEDTAAVLGLRPPDARKVVEAGVAQLVRAIREPTDVRRALRTAGSRMVAAAPATSAAPAVQAAPAARMPRAVVRTLLAPVSEGSASPAAPAPAPAVGPSTLPAAAVAAVESSRPEGPLVTTEVLEQLEAEGPDLVPSASAPARVEIVPARPRRRRWRGSRARLAWAAAAVLVILAALVPAGAGDRSADIGPAIVGMVPAPSIQQQQQPSAPIPLSHVVVVARGDSLWRLAGVHLGDPMRWSEIWRLNRDRRMAPGVRFRSPDLIMPGWRLRLPTP